MSRRVLRKLVIQKREKILGQQLLSFFPVDLPFVTVIQSPFTLVYLLYHIFRIFRHFATNCCIFIHIDIFYNQFTSQFSAFMPCPSFIKQYFDNFILTFIKRSSVYSCSLCQTEICLYLFLSTSKFLDFAVHSVSQLNQIHIRFWIALKCQWLWQVTFNQIHYMLSAGQRFQ